MLGLKLLLCFVLIVNASCRSVNINVQVPWRNYNLSFIAEISEFLTDQSPKLFWQYVDGLCSESTEINNVIKNSTEENLEDLHARSLGIAAALIPDSLHTLLHTMVGLGHYTPTLRFYESLSENFGNPCEDKAFAVFYPEEHVACSISESLHHIHTDSDDIDADVVNEGWEHSYILSSNNKVLPRLGKRVILYGLIGSPSFCAMHSVLSNAADNGSIHSYIVRHAMPGLSVPGFGPDNTVLQGYGVFLDIKNMEYNNVDDDGVIKHQENQSNESAESFALDNNVEIQGINLTRLQESLGADREHELRMLKEELLKIGTAGLHESDEKMKVWKMQDLGLQTIQLVRSASAQNTVFYAMTQLSEMVQNFPKLATMISSAKVSAVVREEVNHWYESGIGNMLPPNSLFINGKRIDLGASTFNVFDLLVEIRQELTVTSKLSSIALSKSAKAQISAIANTVGESGINNNPAVMMMGGGGGGATVRIDVSKGGKYVVHFLNNLEKDAAYRSMPRSLKQLLQPAWSLISVARNMYTLVGAIDVMSTPGASMLLQLYMMQQQHYPVRFGIVFSCAADDNSDQKQTIREDFCRLYMHIREHYSSSESAMNFAVGVASMVTEYAERQKQQNQNQFETTTVIDEDGNQIMNENDDLSLSSSSSSSSSLFALNRQSLIDLYVSTVISLSPTVSKSAASWFIGGKSGKNEDTRTPSTVAAEANEIIITRQHYSDFISNSSAYFDARGLQVNSFSLNGMIVNDANIGGSLMQLLSREQYHLAMLYRTKVITDKTKSLFSTILRHAGAYPKFHPMLEDKTPAYVEYTSAMNDLLTTTSTSSSPTQFIIPSFTSNNTAVVLMHTTLLSVPATQVGFAAAATALQSVIDRSSLPVESISSSNSNAANRIAIFLQIPNYSATNNCDASNNTRNEDNDYCVATSSSQFAVSLITSLQHALLQKNHHHSSSSNVDDASHFCGLICAIILQKAYTLLSHKDSDSTTVSSIDNIVTQLLQDFNQVHQEQSLFQDNDSIDDMKLAMTQWAAANTMASKFDHNINPIDFDSLVTKALQVNEEHRNNNIVLVYNGRKLTIPIDDDSDVGSRTRLTKKKLLYTEDLDLLSALEHSRMTNRIYPIVQEAAAQHDYNDFSASVKYSNLLMQISSYCGQYSSLSNTRRFDVAGVVSSLEEHAATASGNSNGNSALVYHLEPAASSFSTPNEDLQIHYVIDPLSHAGQRASALITLLHDQLQFTQTIVLTPRIGISEFPLQNFYRFVASSSSGSSSSINVAAESSTSLSSSSSTMRATNSDSSSSTSSARFANLPRQHVLTARMDIPEPWNVQAISALQDIDNLRCSNKFCGDDAIIGGDRRIDNSKFELTSISYVLKNIIVAGQCFDSEGGDTSRYSLPPNGLQLTLTEAVQHAPKSSTNKTSTTAFHADTLVMQNLGYFQMQANPGLYELNLAQGKATHLYTIVKIRGVGGSDSRPRSVDNTESGMIIAVRSFEDTIHRLVVSKRPGKQHLTLLDDLDSSGSSSETKKGSNRGGGGIWKSLSSSLFGSDVDKFTEEDTAAAANAVVVRTDNHETAAAAEDDRIHVFSLATGHMYERLLRIMMLSVTRHTSKPVKFWLFENYLSPAFKQTAAVMAKEYGFEVGYVTYKWPQWLTQQTQQQRIIWGYKILFLDVLFPLNVKKVIYVDADQVIRADLKELWEMDLQGAAYGYTPFCTSRKETLGFQFWQQGYWKDHLQGRPYHISALYVVDLQRFRHNSVGDTLRATYDQLSRDPNSLANLDQDLPNYAQHQVPIFSLPQEWLWCETWCSDKSKSKAKTIDLCNNPLHKEPKLDMARRVISGKLFNESWVQLDEEIRTLQRRQGLVSGINE